MSAPLLILASQSVHFPRQYIHGMAQASYVFEEHNNLEEYIGSENAAKAHVAILEISQPEDLLRARVLFQWLRMGIEAGTVKTILLLSSKAWLDNMKVKQLMAHEVACLPLPAKNILFKLELQKKLLEKVQEETKEFRIPGGFEITEEKEEITFLRGPSPELGRWKRMEMTPQGKIRWRWIEAKSQETNQVEWELHGGEEEPRFVPVDNLWAVKSPPPVDVIAKQDEKVLFSAQNYWRAKKNKLYKKEPISTEAKLNQNKEEVLKKEEKLGSLQKKNEISEISVSDSEVAASPSGGSKNSLKEKMERAKEKILQDSVEERVKAEKQNVETEAVKKDLPQAKDTEKQKQAVFLVQEENLKNAESGDKKVYAEKAVRVSDLTPEERLSSLNPMQKGIAESVIPPQKVEQEKEGNKPEQPNTFFFFKDSQTSVKKESGSDSSPQEQNSKSGSSMGDKQAYPIKSSAKELDREKRVEKNTSSQATQAMDQKLQAQDKSSQKETKKILEREDDGLEKRDVPSPNAQEKKAQSAKIPSEREDSPRQEKSVSEDREISKKIKKEEERGEEHFGSIYSRAERDISNLSSWSEREKIADIVGVAKEKNLQEEQVIDGQVDKIAEVHVVTGQVAAFQTPEITTAGRKYFTKSLEELADRNSSWLRNENYRFYLSAEFSYYGLPKIEAAMPIWIYEGELAPAFLDLERAWKFYDVEPRRLENLSALPAPVLLALSDLVRKYEQLDPELKKILDQVGKAKKSAENNAVEKISTKEVELSYAGESAPELTKSSPLGRFFDWIKKLFR